MRPARAIWWRWPTKGRPGGEGIEGRSIADVAMPSPLSSSLGRIAPQRARPRNSIGERPSLTQPPQSPTCSSKWSIVAVAPSSAIDFTGAAVVDPDLDTPVRIDLAALANL